MSMSFEFLNSISLLKLQVPQIILDDCSARSQQCRILCTQPRRIAALSIADRVAAERGERIGQTVGYQIRLESKWVCVRVCVFLHVMEGRELISVICLQIFAFRTV